MYCDACLSALTLVVTSCQASREIRLGDRDRDPHGLYCTVLRCAVLERPRDLVLNLLLVDVMDGGCVHDKKQATSNKQPRLFLDPLIPDDLYWQMARTDPRGHPRSPRQSAGARWTHDSSPLTVIGRAMFRRTKAASAWTGHGRGQRLVPRQRQGPFQG